MPSDKLLDFLFDSEVRHADPLMADLIELEDERQARQIILIPSESICAWPVRKVLDSSFTNLYAEGYPARENTLMGMDELADLPTRLVRYRRYGDRRFYKGNAYVNLVESICQTRAAECFATEKTPADRIHANVQALSGAAANLAVYEAFVPLGGTVMGLNLIEGGHLSHGSKFHMTGKRYNIVSYRVDPQTELLDYDAIMKLAKESRPRMIIAGYTSYPWAPDFAKFREIADEVGAILMADIAHPAGLVIAGEYPNPIDHCDVVTVTTHKTLMGPRGAVILTPHAEYAAKIHAAVFPGEQGGPHINNIAALAVAFKLAQTDEFRQLQRRIVSNAKLLGEEFTKLGLRLSYGGTNTHKLLLDLKPLTPKGQPLLYGEPAAHILELAGIVLNKNTIPGDTATSLASGLRLGTPWITQRGAGPAEIKQLAQMIHRVLTSITPFHYDGPARLMPRGKIDMKVLTEVSEQVDAFCRKLHVRTPQISGYPHFPYLDNAADIQIVKIVGEDAASFLLEAAVEDVTRLKGDDVATTLILDADGVVLDQVAVARLPLSENPSRNGFLMKVNPANAKALLAWLRALADGYTAFDRDDVTGKITGAVVIQQMIAECDFAQTCLAKLPDTDATLAGSKPTDVQLGRPYFVGQAALAKDAPADAKPAFSWSAKEAPLKTTTLHATHKAAGGVMVPFAGYEMPVRYGSIIEEHNAVREAAGLFDVSHMGVFDATGPRAMEFVDTVCSNFARGLAVGEAQYTYLLDPNGDVIDDLLVYRLEEERILLVVNAANEDKDWAWLTAVNEGRVLLDADVPQRAFGEPTTLRNLKDAKWGDQRRVDIALQGPLSRRILVALTTTTDRGRLGALQRNECMYTNLAGIDAVVSGTGYTGEPVAYEIFIHPDKAPALWDAILAEGAELGVRPIGLGARDSLRIEAGLPLYGHELAGPHALLPREAAFGSFVKIHKAFFVGKAAYLRRAFTRDMRVVRFGVPSKGNRPLKTGDPVINDKGACIGYVTSCATDGQGLLIGQALVQGKYTGRCDIQIVPLPPEGKAPTPAADLTVGKRLTMPVHAQVLPRFLKKK